MAWRPQTIRRVVFAFMAAIEVGRETFVRLRGTGVRWREVAGSIVVMDMNAASFYAVDGSVAEHWHRIVEGVSVEELLTTLAAEYDASEDEILDDLCELLEQLSARNAVELTQGAGDRGSARASSSPRR